VRAEGTANDAATIHTPQTVAAVVRHVDCEETRTLSGNTITMYRWMLSTAIEYADKLTDIRRQNGKKRQKMSRGSDVACSITAEERSTDKYMISLIAKLRIYIFGTVRMSLLHVIMIIMKTLPVVPNIKRTTDIGNL
jgi:hypothetical protein